MLQANRKIVLGTVFILILIVIVTDIFTDEAMIEDLESSVGISLRQKLPVAATNATALALDQRKTSLEGTSETRRGEPEKENREIIDGTLETTETKTKSPLNQELSKNSTLTEEQGVLGSFFMPELSNMRYPEYGNMTAAEKVADEYLSMLYLMFRHSIINVGRKKSYYDPLATCSVTSQVRIIQKSSQWIMQSIDINGNNKTVGGDEFYVTYTDNNPPDKGNHTAAALIQDLENGLYALTFKTTPMDPHPGNLTGVGTLSVRFLYTCNIGIAHPPVKDKWKAGGATLIHHTKSNVTQPPIQSFRPPSGVDLSPFDLVVSFGDSMMENFVRSKTGEKLDHRPKTVWVDNPTLNLYSGSLSRLLEKLESWHGKQHLNNGTNVALLLGSSAWDIIRPEKPLPDFSDHLGTCRRFVLKVQDLYPNVTVFWKAPAAIVRTIDSLSFPYENVMEYHQVMLTQVHFFTARTAIGIYNLQEK
jgi:hypothetical protein